MSVNNWSCDSYYLFIELKIPNLIFFSSKAVLEIHDELAAQIQNSTEAVEYIDGVSSIGKKHALKIYDQFALNTSCFRGSMGSNITPVVVQFREVFVTKIMNKLIYYYYYC